MLKNAGREGNISSWRDTAQEWHDAAIADAEAFAQRNILLDE